MDWHELEPGQKPGQVKANDSTIKIHVSELKIGMFVFKLDRDWSETPFLMQGFKIETLADIERVTEYAQYVWIDATLGAWPPSRKRVVRKSSVNKVSYVNKVDAGQEHKVAIGIYKQAHSVTQKLLEDARLGDAINAGQATDIVKECVHSILRNPDALIWMSRMRTEDLYTAEHCLNVCIMSIAFGRHLGMAETELEKLGLCGLLHDVGKMRVPAHILNKVEPLTPKESKIIQAHSVHGRNLLLASNGMPETVIDVAYSHHEKIDGSGYPRKLVGEEISMVARIVAIVDAYDAMTADRCYSKAIPSNEALKNIFNDRGTHFDEHLALEYIKCVGLYPPGSIVELVNGLVGIVLETNYRYRHLPKIIVVRDLNRGIESEQMLMLDDIERKLLSREYLIRRILSDGSHGIFIRDYFAKGTIFDI